MKMLNKEYWENRYLNKDTGWDTGHITTPLKNYIDQLNNNDLKLLIPGVGNGYEFDYLIKHKFKNTTVIDISSQPIINLRFKHPEYEDQIILGDFFEHKEKYDCIIEQTFFCALDPNLRTAYCNKIHNLLNKNGKVVGLLFNFELTEVGPPFGGNIVEYTKLFYEKFSINVLERCYNSIKPRDGRELFFIFEKN